MLEKCQNGKDDEDDYQFSGAGIILASLHKSPLSVHLPHPSHHCRACRDYLGIFDTSTNVLVFVVAYVFVFVFCLCLKICSALLKTLK